MLCAIAPRKIGFDGGFPMLIVKSVREVIDSIRYSVHTTRLEMLVSDKDTITDPRYISIISELKKTNRTRVIATRRAIDDELQEIDRLLKSDID